MKLVLSTSPHVRHVAVLQGDFEPDPSVMYSFAPVGLLSLIAALRRDRPEVSCTLYDVNRRILAGALPMDGRLYDAVAHELVASAPDVVGFMTECDSYHHILQICRAVKTLEPECKVILGGPHASAVAAETMHKHGYVDAVVVGEGELTLCHLIRAIGRDEAVPGALVRRSDGSVLDGGARALVDDLDELPVPAYDLYVPDPGEEIFLEVGRGCPFKCSFCSTAPYWRRRHRVKSPERIVAEIRLLQQLYGTTKIHFTHDLFTTSRAWVSRVCENLTAAGSPVAWTCSARTDTVDPPLLLAMAEAGCTAIYFGIESGSERILREICKAIPLERSFEVLKSCRAAGITPNVGFILGFPTEDGDSLEATFQAYERALRSGCKPAHIFAFCPFADSAIYPTLQDLRCTGHYVDLPLGKAADEANRALVAADPKLHGALFRPVLGKLLGETRDAIDGSDEFSPLVEALLAPSLALADLRGGLAKVFELWLPWIRARNVKRGAGASRRSYGSPLDFADFLVEMLEADASPPRAALAAAQFLRTNLSTSGARQATTMANHRSLGTSSSVQTLGLGSRLTSAVILAKLALDFEVSPVLSGQFDCDFAEEPSFYIWQGGGDGSIRLIRVGRDIYNLVVRIARGPITVGDLLLAEFDEAPRTGSAVRGAQDTLSSAGAAVDHGLVLVGD